MPTKQAKEEKRKAKEEKKLKAKEEKRKAKEATRKAKEEKRKAKEEEKRKAKEDAKKQYDKLNEKIKEEMKTSYDPKEEEAKANWDTNILSKVSAFSRVVSTFPTKPTDKNMKKVIKAVDNISKCIFGKNHRDLNESFRHPQQKYIKKLQNEIDVINKLQHESDFIEKMKSYTDPANGKSYADLAEDLGGVPKAYEDHIAKMNELGKIYAQWEQERIQLAKLDKIAHEK